MDPLFKSYLDKEEGTESWSESLFVGAYDITPQDHINVQVAVQKYVDSCISKTINIKDGVDFNALSEHALNSVAYLKGLTVYMGGTKEEEPLEAIPLTSANVREYFGSDSEQVSPDACSLAGGECSE